jgi:hypothetical protein
LRTDTENRNWKVKQLSSLGVAFSMYKNEKKNFKNENFFKWLLTKNREIKIFFYKIDPSRHIHMYEGTTYLTQKVLTTSHQGCQLAYFQTKNLKLGKFWRVFKNIDVNQFIDI